MRREISAGRRFVSRSVGNPGRERRVFRVAWLTVVAAVAVADPASALLRTAEASPVPPAKTHAASSCTNPAPARPVAPLAATNAPAAATPGYTYIHDVIAAVPWSIHVLKMERYRADLALDTVMGQGSVMGMGIVSEMARLAPPELGKPVAAINGDFFNYSEACPGDPEGLQIVHGELISAPHPERVCFWEDAKGGYHRAQVTGNFQVKWPNGVLMPFGLNEARDSDGIVLYTAAHGSSTGTGRGLELILAGQTNSPWLPLQIGKTCLARVIGVNDLGDSPITRKIMVLSIGPGLVARLPKLQNGAVLQLSTATTPDLAGARTALGGGPTLVAGGKPWHWKGYIQLRHPRTAIGWSKDHFFMVEVDGRQSASLGMTFPELADYLIKLGCEEAMNLDGGGSSTLWVDGRVANNPSPGAERACANALILLKKAK
jgi:large repetitive protein